MERGDLGCVTCFWSPSHEEHRLYDCDAVVSMAILFVLKAKAAHFDEVAVFTAVVAGTSTYLTTSFTPSTSTIFLEFPAASTTEAIAVSTVLVPLLQAVAVKIVVFHVSERSLGAKRC